MVYSYNICGYSSPTTGPNFTVGAPPPPCVSQGQNTGFERIAKVQFGSINNSSTGTAGYENFTSISTTVNRGASYTITITPWMSAAFTEGYAVYIDYNKNGIFDTGETVWTQAPTTASSVSGVISIPANALTGTTRMRVSMKYAGIPGACETFAYGQVEDYTINIIAPANASPAEIMALDNMAPQGEVTLYPNPVHDMLTVKGLDNTGETVNATVYNINGSVVKIFSVKLETTVQINVSDLPKNNYILNISGKKLRFIKN